MKVRALGFLIILLMVASGCSIAPESTVIEKLCHLGDDYNTITYVYRCGGNYKVVYDHRYLADAADLLFDGEGNFIASCGGWVQEGCEQFKNLNCTRKDLCSWF